MKFLKFVVILKITTYVTNCLQIVAFHSWYLEKYDLFWM